jgi:hypothetical protein
MGRSSPKEESSPAVEGRSVVDREELAQGQHVSHALTRSRAAPWSRVLHPHSGRAAMYAYARRATRVNTPALGARRLPVTSSPSHTPSHPSQHACARRSLAIELAVARAEPSESARLRSALARDRAHRRTR